MPTTTLALGWAELHVASLGLACCAVEVVAARATGLVGDAPGDVIGDASDDASDDGSRPTAPRAHVLVVAGTVTTAQAGTVRALYDAMPEPRRVIAFGACATSGGPYWDSYAVVAGVDSIVPVDAYVAGCPPRPEALLDGLAVVAGTL